MPKKLTKKLTRASILEQVNECKDRIAKERDKLRDLIDELDAVADSCDEAEQALESAADYLSEYL